MSGLGLHSVDPLYLRVPEVEGEGVAAAELEGEEEEDYAYRVHLIPRSSPTPRKKSAGCEEQEEPYLSRKVSFADTCGLNLVQVKYFQEFPFPESPEGTEVDAQEQGAQCPFYIFPAFILPASPAHLMDAVRRDKVEVESIQPIEGDPLSVQGVLRVLNLSFQKSVYVRATLDNWSSHYDHPADYIPGSSDGATDQFGFRLSFVGPYASDGARLEFVVRYETPAGTYWANNGGNNYSVVCKLKEEAAPTPKAFAGGEVGHKELRSCLKPRTWRFHEQDEDTEKAEWDRQDRTEDTDASSFSDHRVVQVPKVQVINPLTQAHPEGITSSLPDQPQEALENHVQQNKFIPIEEAQEAGTDERVSTLEPESYQGLCTDAFQQEEPVNTTSPSSQIEKEDENRDSLEAQGGIEVPLSQQGSRAQRSIEAKVLCLAEEMSLPIESHLDKAVKPFLQAKGIPVKEANSRVMQKPEPIVDENSGQGTSWQEVDSQATGSEPWQGNLNAAKPEIGTADWEETPVQQAHWEETPVQQAPWEETPVQQAPWEETPVQQAPWEETPVQQAPWEETPVQQAPWEETPVQQAPWEETPVQQAPWEETPVQQAHWEETPVQQAPWEETPVQQAPWEETPVQQAPWEETPVQQAPWEETPVQQAPWEETPVQQAPWEETPVQQAPWEETPVQQAPWEETPVQQAPWEETPVQQAPWEETPVQQAPWEETPVQQAPWEEMPVQQAPAPVEVVAAGVCRSEGSARLYLAASLHAVGTYHKEPGAQDGHGQTLQPEAGSPASPTGWQITSKDGPLLTGEEGQELPSILPHGASSAQGLASLSASASDDAAPKLGPLGEHQAGGITGSCWAREGDAQVGERGAGVDRVERAGTAPFPSLSAHWDESKRGGTCTDMNETGSEAETSLAACVHQDDPDLQSLAVLKEVIIMASIFMRFLVFLLVAFSDSSSVLWCTLYLISVFLL